MKKLFYAFPVVILILTGFKSNAQFENIDLNDYKLNIYKYSSLSSTFEGANNVSKSSNTNTFYGTKYSSKYDFNNFSSAGNLFFLTKKYTKKYYGYHSVEFNFNNNFQKISSTGDYAYSNPQKENENTLSEFISIYSKNIFYIQKDIFLGMTVNTTHNPINAYSKSTQESTTNKSTQNSYQTLNSVSLLVGNGRIEEVSDARLAIYILDDLAKHGRLARTPSEDEVFKFADFLTTLQNTRIIDSRNKKIKEYMEIDSFLVSNNLSKKSDGLYFGLINDNWNYARSQNWETGHSWDIGVAPFYNYNEKFYQESSTYPTEINSGVEKLTMYGIQFLAEYNFKWISGLKWQNGFRFAGSYNINKYNTVNNAYYYYYNEDEKFINMNAIYEISYIPNTRTLINMNAGIDAKKLFMKDIDNYSQANFNVSGNCDYYFSEKLRFQIGASIGYFYNSRDYKQSYYINYESKNFYINMNVGLQYYFF